MRNSVHRIVAPLCDQELWVIIATFYKFYFSICCCTLSKNILHVIAIGNVWKI